MTALKVVSLHQTTLRDCPGKLRELANAIEAGEYGAVGCVGVALLGDTFEVFGFGDGIKDDGCAPSVATLFRSGALRLEMQIERHGK
jgi:hypothetical protein